MSKCQEEERGITGQTAIASQETNSILGKGETPIYKK